LLYTTERSALSSDALALAVFPVMFGLHLLELPA
jgi:hypothetical protein